MRLLAAAALATLIAAPAVAQPACVPVTTLQMIRAPGANADLVPVSLNGVIKNFLFDTGGTRTQIEPGVVQDLRLPVRTGGIQLYSVTGTVSRDLARVGSFSLGEIHEDDVDLSVSPVTGLDGTADGILAPDLLKAYDVDIDFGTDTLRLFLPGTCSRPADTGKTTMLPLISDGRHIIAPVMLDGHEIDAMVDTGATSTALRMDIAQKFFGLEMGTDDTPAHGVLNEDDTLTTYSHVFKTLSFASAAVENPAITIFPDVMDRDLDRNEPLNQRITSRGAERVSAPPLILGMDMMRKLHLIFAFRDGRIVIAPATQAGPEAVVLNKTPAGPPGMLQAAYKRHAMDQVRDDNRKIIATPGDAQLWNHRCWLRATAKIDLDAALSDCDHAIRLKPGVPALLDSRAFVLFQQGKYRDALDAYNLVLKTDPRFPSSLFMRGFTKGKLGDAAGKESDVAAAIEAQPEIQAQFRPYDISY